MFLVYYFLILIKTMGLKNARDKQLVNNNSDSNGVSLEDKLEAIKNNGVVKNQKQPKKHVKTVLDDLNIDDNCFTIPVESFNTPHYIILLINVIVPIIMFSTLVSAEGVKGIMSGNFLVIIVFLAIFTLCSMGTKNMCRIRVDEIEKSVNNDIIILDDKNDDKRPMFLTVFHAKDGAYVSFNYVTRMDWDSNIMARKKGAAIIKDNKAAFIHEK